MASTAPEQAPAQNPAPDAMDLSDEDDDPVVASYDVFLTPTPKDSLYLLQYPFRKREAPYSSTHNSLPTELRIKELKSNFLEVDIGVDTTTNYDKLKGVVWGRAARHARDAEAAGFGLSAGFGNGRTEVIASKEGGGARARARAARKEDDPERLVKDFEEKVARGQVLAKQTLGGQLKGKEEGAPRYMVGNFRGDELHLTDVTATVQMRPQFHHLDAQTQITKMSIAKAQATKPKAQEPRAALPPVSRGVEEADDKNAHNLKAIEDRLQKIADARWSKLHYRDELETAAFELFDQKLFLKDPATAPKLQSEWNSKQYLDAINTPAFDPKILKTSRRAGGGRAQQTKPGPPPARAGPSGGPSRR